MGSNKSMLSCILHKNLSKTLLLVKICWGHGVLRNSNRQDKSKESLWIPPWNSSTPSLCTAEKQPPHNQIWSPLHQTLYSTLWTLQTIVFNRSVEFCGTGLCPLWCIMVHNGICQQPVQQTRSDIHWYKSEVQRARSFRYNSLYEGGGLI